MKTVFSSFFVFLCAVNFAFAQSITFDSLLDEMVDRSAIARFPDPAYTCKQASSYDRASATPDDQHTWFANGDASHFVREEMNGDRKEWVLMDVEGPGAITRWWITAFKYVTTVRIYLDGSDTPAIEANIGEFIGGDFTVGEPLSIVTANGRNTYLPIPYAKSCKVTVDQMWTGDKDKEQDCLFYQICYRTYASGTKVESFSMDAFNAAKDKVDAVQKKLVDFSALDWVAPITTIKAGKSASIPADAGPRVIETLRIKLDAEDRTQAYRSTILRIEFDDMDEPAVYCPVGEFFGSGVGINPYKSWYSQVYEDGTMVSHWPMPYRQNCTITLINAVGEQDVKFQLELFDKPWDWDDRSMYFHCNWRQDRNMSTHPRRDWEYVKLAGEGVFVGDVLTLLNYYRSWWGEGDEKIYVDGEKFPSHFGTGTEDYYGYAWCTPRYFTAPFHAQPRAEGPGNYGNVTNLRFRSLDGIPFTKDFKFDMEIWHSTMTRVDYAAATFWYGKPGAKVVDGPSEAQILTEAKAPVQHKSPPELPNGVSVPGFTFKKTPPGYLSMQRMGKDYRDGDQLWWTGTKVGDVMDLLVTLEKSGPQKLICALTRASDYANIRFLLNGKEIGKFDGYNTHISYSEVEIGTVDVPAGKHVLSIEVLGKDERSKNTLVGIDYFRFE